MVPQQTERSFVQEVTACQQCFSDLETFHFIIVIQWPVACCGAFLPPFFTRTACKTNLKNNHNLLANWAERNYDKDAGRTWDGLRTESLQSREVHDGNRTENQTGKN
jgi:hypothetical protein